MRWLLAALLFGCCAVAQQADLVLRNGRIWTANTRAPWAEALAIRGETIAAVGAFQRAWVGPKTRVVDLGGRMAMPGINDAHTHLLMGSLGLFEVDLNGACSLEEMQKRVADFARANPAQPWITGRGWEYYCLPNQRLPRREDLDAVVPDRPVYLKAYDGHTGWANSRALRMAEVFRDTKFDGFGEIVRDADGEPTGALKEGAMSLVARHVPPDTREHKLRALAKGLQFMASLGVTSVQNASGNEEEVELFATLPHTLRIGVAMSSGKATAEQVARWAALKRRHAASPWLRVSAVKFMIDGVIESKTAAMLAPYADGSGEVGSPAWDPAEFNAAVARVDKAGLQIYTHAIGDRGVRIALDAYERAGNRAGRHRIEHIETIDAADIPRFARLGVLASMEPIHADPDGVNVWSQMIGPARLPRSFPWRSLEQAGARLVFSSDWPACASVNPWRGLHNAVNRRTAEGRPDGGWIPEQRVSLETALRAYTINAAYASFEERFKGSIEPRKAADLIVLSQDLFQIDPMKIHQTRVLVTLVGGQKVAGDFDLLPADQNRK